MEHLVILLIHFVLWLDRLTLRSLKRVVPHVDELRANPARVLAEEDIIIGPTRRWFSTLALGLSVGFFVWFGASLFYLWVCGHRQGERLNPVDKWVVFALFVGALYLTTMVVLYFRRGGMLVLTSEGVEFRHRRTVLHCPWALFDTEGHPFFSSRERMLLPVNPRALPLVKLLRGDRLLAEGMRAKCKGLRFQSVNLAALRAYYEVIPTDVGELLLEIGRKLRAPVPQRETTHLDQEEPLPEEVPPLVRQPGGVMTANLTRLNLPPFCCVCQQATANRVQFHVHQMSLRALGLRLLELGQTVTLLVPMCHDCQRLSKRTKWRGLVFGIFASFPILIGLFILAGMAKGLEPLPGLLALAGIANLILTPVLGYKMGDARSRQVLIDRYRPTEGTVDVWFRSRRYAEAVVALHPTPEERPAVKV